MMRAQHTETILAGIGEARIGRKARVEHHPATARLCRQHSWHEIFQDLELYPVTQAACQGASHCRSPLRTASAGSALWLWGCPHTGLWQTGVGPHSKLQVLSSASKTLRVCLRFQTQRPLLPKSAATGSTDWSLTWINEGRNKFATSQPRLAGTFGKKQPSCPPPRVLGRRRPGM